MHSEVHSTVRKPGIRTSCYRGMMCLPLRADTHTLFTFTNETKITATSTPPCYNTHILLYLCCILDSSSTLLVENPLKMLLQLHTNREHKNHLCANFHFIRRRTFKFWYVGPFQLTSYPSTFMCLFSKKLTFRSLHLVIQCESSFRTFSLAGFVSLLLTTNSRPPKACFA